MFSGVCGGLVGVLGEGLFFSVVLGEEGNGESDERADGAAAVVVGVAVAVAVAAAVASVSGAVVATHF